MMHEVAVSDHGVTGETVVHVRLETLISLFRFNLAVELCGV
jgi:hypothetical protein